MANGLEKRQDLRVTFAAIVESAPSLREAGVLAVTVDGITVQFAPMPPEHGDVIDREPKPEKPRRIWDDPDLYGRPEDAPVPKLKKEE